jgi:hypothetical protein
LTTFVQVITCEIINNLHISEELSFRDIVVTLIEMKNNSKIKIVPFNLKINHFPNAIISFKKIKSSTNN